MRRLRQLARLVLQVEDSPRRVALAFSVGMFIAFFPVLGTHTAVGLIVAASVCYLSRWLARRISRLRKTAEGGGCGCASEDSTPGPKKGQRAEFIGVIDRRRKPE